jgi:8-oxo-dGTP diphosphatase
MDIDQLQDFKAEYESGGRILINSGDAIKYYPNWNELYQEILDDALRHQ